MCRTWPQSHVTNQETCAKIDREKGRERKTLFYCSIWVAISAIHPIHVGIDMADDTVPEVGQHVQDAQESVENGDELVGE